MECTQNRSENMSGKATTEKSKTEKAESLPEGWKRVRLGEIIQENIKSPFKVEDAGDEGQYPFFTSGEVVKRISRWLIDGENLFLSSGGSFYVKYYRGRASYSGDTWALKGKGKIENKYLFYFLKYNTGHITYRYFIGSGLEHLQKDFFKSSFQISYPENLSEQKKIAEILETVDNAIEKTDAIIEKYRRIKKGLMADLLTGKIRLIPYGHSEAEGEESPLLTSPEAKKFVIGDKTFVAVPNQRWKDTPIGKIPEDWEVAKMNSIIKEGLISGIWGEEPKDYENVYPILRSTEITHSGKIETETVEFRKVMLERSKISKYVLRNGDILIVSSSGSEELIGRVAIFKDSGNETFLFSNFLLRLRVGETTSHMYIFYFLSSFWYQSFLAKFQETSTGLRNFPKNEFLALLFPLPPLPEQQLIADVLSEVDEVIEKEIQYKEKLERIKKGLMEDLLTGKVRVNNLIKENIQNDTKVL
jgi:type I restriction enzyme S subunit